MSLTNFTPLDAIVDQDAIKLALQKVLCSETFTSAPRLQRFLEYVVLETVAGNNAKLKGFTIAYDVFDRKDPDEAQTTTIVRVEAGRLRKRLENYYESEGRDDSIRIEIPKGRYIASFTKKMSPVSTVPDADAMSAVEESDPDSLPGPPPDTVTTGPFSDRPGLVWALIALVAFFCGVWSSNALTNFIGNRSTPEKAEKSHKISPVYTKPTIAILPLEVYEKSEAINGLALSITEALISEIGRIKEINVIALSSMRYYRDQVTSVKDIGATLAASHVFKGGLSKNDDGLFISLALYDAGTGFVKWTTDIELPQYPQNKVRSQVVAQSLSAISRELGIGEKNLSPEKRLAELDPEEHSLYLQGLDLMNPPSDVMRMHLALGIFKQIVQNNPDSAEGHGGLALVHASRLWWGHSDSPEEDVATAILEADSALRLDPNQVMPYLSLAILALYERDHEQALSLLGKAVEIQPNNPYALSHLAAFKIFAGEGGDDSLQLIQQAIRLDPLNRRAPYWNILGVVYFHRQEYEQALTAFLENTRRSGPFGPHIKAYLVATYFKTENYVEAKRLAKSLTLDTSDFAWQDWITRSFKDPLEGGKVSSVIEQAVLDTASAR